MLVHKWQNIIFIILSLSVKCNTDVTVVILFYSIGVFHPTREFFTLYGDVTITVRPLFSQPPPHYWSCSSELCVNFVLVYGVIISTNQIAYLNAVRYLLRWWKSFCTYVFVSPRTCCLLRSKGQSFRNTFSRIKVTIWLVNIISTEHDQ